MNKISKKSIFFNDLLNLNDIKYKKFMHNLVPNILEENILGVRIPLIRKFAKQILKDYPTKVQKFLLDLPHAYYDENNLHVLLINEEKNFLKLINYLQKLLPYLDNWATCDLIRPKIFSKHKNELQPYIKQWLYSGKEYVVRFAIEILMIYFLDSDFKLEYFSWIVLLQQDSRVNDKYYVKMMIAWYFATALYKQFDYSITILESGLLDVWTHNMTIQKAVESNRILESKKKYLKSLKKDDLDRKQIS